MPTDLPSDVLISHGEMNLINSFRTIWREFALWTRSMFIADLTGLGNLNAVFNRLYSIPETFINQLRVIFGENADILVQPLSMHIVYLLDLFEAQKNNDVEGVNAATTLLYQNADELANAFAQINPFWDEAQWRNLLYQYLSLTFQESTAILEGKFDLDVDIYDRISTFTTLIGDYTATGVLQYLRATGM